MPRSHPHTLAFLSVAEQDVQSDVRAQLDAEREHLDTQLAELEAGSEKGLEFDENFADSAQVAAEQGENRELATSLRKQLEEVDGALERLDEGTYGSCANCGKAIAPERLQAMPATPFCIDCA